MDAAALLGTSGSGSGFNVVAVKRKNETSVILGAKYVVGTAKLSSDLVTRSQYGVLSETTEREGKRCECKQERDSCVVMVGVLTIPV